VSSGFAGWFLPENVRPYSRPTNLNPLTSDIKSHTLAGDVKSPQSTSSIGVRAEKFRERRRLVALEILNTERSFVQQMECLERVYVHPFEHYHQLVSEVPAETHQLLFGNLRTLLPLNQQLLADLDAALLPVTQSPDSEFMIGPIFVRFGPFLKMYSAYVSNLEGALQQLERMSVSQAASFPRFNTFVQESARDPICKGLSLQALLITPVQRIPRYKLLLQELLQCTPNEHADFKAVSEALQKVNAVAAQINEDVMVFQNRALILQIERAFNSNPGFLATSRVLIKTGMLTKRNNSNGINNAYQFFLFNDLLAYGKPLLGGTGLALKWKLSLEELQVKALGIQTQKTGDAASWWFCVTTPVKPLILSVTPSENFSPERAEAEGKSWLELISMWIEESLERKRSLSRSVSEGDSSIPTASKLPSRGSILLPARPLPQALDPSLPSRGRAVQTRVWDATTCNDGSSCIIC
jgi:hypothetical protein